MSYWLKQSTAVTVVLGPFVDDTDGKTAKTALSVSQSDVRLSKNGGDFAQKNDANAATHDENGYYDVALDATDTGTLGRLRVAVSEAGALPVWADFEVVPAQVWDSFFASDRLQVDTRELGDANLALTTQMKADVNAEADTALSDYDAPTNAEMNARTLPSANYFDPAADTVANVTTVGSVTGAVTAGTVNDKTGYALTAAYDAAKTAAQAATALSNATWTNARAALLDYLDAAITSRLATAGYTAPNNTGITTLLDRLTALRAGYLDKLNVTGTLAHSDAAATYKADVSGLALETTAQSILTDTGTDGVVVAAASKTGYSLSAAGVQAIWDALVTALTTAGSIGKRIVDYVDAAISSRSSHTAANVRTEMDSNSTQLAAIVADTNELQAEMADGGRTDLLIDGIKAKTDSLTFTTAGKVDARVDNVAGTAVAGPNDLKADVSALATSAEIAALNNVSAADVRTQADAALTAYDPPTKAELTTAVSGLAAETTAQSIKAKTDQLTFTTPNKVDASAEVTVDAEAIAEAVAEVVGETVAGEVWDHTPRTLTQIGVMPAPTTTADEISRRRGDDWEIAITGLSLAGYTEVWFTAKRGYGYTDADALLMVTETGGLARINGAAPAVGDAAKAALAVNAGNDTVTVMVDAAITALLPTGTFVYDAQWMNGDGEIHTVSLGTLAISGDVTRATG